MSKEVLVVQATGRTVRVCISAEQRHFSPLQDFQTGSGAHPTSYSMGTGFFPDGKVAGA